jgi:hypothetical protein
MQQKQITKSYTRVYETSRYMMMMMMTMHLFQL